MTNESKRRLATICLFASVVLLFPALYGKLFVKPEPGWSELGFAIGMPVSIIGNFLMVRAK
jgi:hypothetical protein